MKNRVVEGGGPGNGTCPVFGGGRLTSGPFGHEFSGRVRPFDGEDTTTVNH